MGSFLKLPPAATANRLVSGSFFHPRARRTRPQLGSKRKITAALPHPRPNRVRFSKSSSEDTPPLQWLLHMRLASAQINNTIGDLDANAAKTLGFRFQGRPASRRCPRFSKNWRLPATRLTIWSKNILF
jgi:hypothetical protein